ncbi:unnamed protein product [Haemonchus placei]|uniref:Small monomeric GTPase n=1 Tax=Haemonchus placei TaxID=6290 RepID=A0A0N4WSV8_HAEPC|nr:unnamed protein product [Haemonchus placei]
MKRPYRIAVFGASACGKTALIRRFVSGDYTDIYDPTIEDRYKKTMIYQGKPVHLEILDSSGKVRFVFLLTAIYLLSMPH